MTITVARIHIEVPDDLHRRAKAAAAMQGVTLKDFVIQAIEDAIEGGETSGVHNVNSAHSRKGSSTSA